MPRINQSSISEVQRGLNVRFFEAVRTLVKRREMRSLSGFVEECGLYAPRYREMRMEFDADAGGGHSRYKCVEAEALYGLVSRYGVSGDWLITGRGEMMMKHEASC